jgi:hypothetical protein
MLRSVAVAADVVAQRCVPGASVGATLAHSPEPLTADEPFILVLAALPMTFSADATLRRSRSDVAVYPKPAVVVARGEPVSFQPAKGSLHRPL